MHICKHICTPKSALIFTHTVMKRNEFIFTHSIRMHSYLYSHTPTKVIIFTQFTECTQIYTQIPKICIRIHTHKNKPIYTPIVMNALIFTHTLKIMLKIVDTYAKSTSTERLCLPILELHWKF